MSPKFLRRERNYFFNNSNQKVLNHNCKLPTETLVFFLTIKKKRK